MAYPPTVPPATRTNPTPQADNHPSDHNVISAALSDIINELGANPSLSFATVQAALTALGVPSFADWSAWVASGGATAGRLVVVGNDAFVTMGGTVLRGISTKQQPSIPVTGGNVIGLVQLAGTITIPADNCARRWVFWWQYQVAGHVSSGTFQPRAYTPGGALQMAGADQGFATGIPMTGIQIFSVDQAAQAAATFLNTWAFVQGANANTNVAGSVFSAGYPV